ncbi:GDSL esterase/lipase At2g04570-like isoform X2 [Papaver somniferum]|uniref:GDSL esterase/lipase At2g04570-like isoform X2 n=1 Tax=Papaver somniferum TaxID=3469 RepID=UPI000E6F7EF1|nr:GDSL esterase/lipase At2g04570-like isoform X2 [Papaver somniferum]
MATQYSLLLCFLNILVFSVLEITGRNKIPGIIVFGDSTVDAGNNNQIPTLAKDMLGIKHSIPAYLDPDFGIEDFATGVTFASAGTGYDVATSKVLDVIPLAKELEYFKEYLKKLTSLFGKDSAAETARESLYFISIGTNDFIENYFTVPGRSFQFTVAEYENFLLGIARNFLIELYSLGARKIGLLGLPPCGYLPIAKTENHVSGRPNLEELNEASKEFNVKLQNLVASLSKELEGIKLVYADIYNSLLHIIQNPNLYGFENVEEGCCATGTFELGVLCKAGNAISCTDPSKYVFWDSVHPSEKVYGILANILMDTLMSHLVN